VVKLLENTFRAINIAQVNEVAIATTELSLVIIIGECRTSEEGCTLRRYGA
jgi:UDP-N-acetyl-D-mannosaminuronate dehydrogenase